MAPPWRSRSTASARCRTGSRRARSWRRAPRNGNIATFDLASGRADVDSLLVSIPILLSIGCIVGFLAGLLGVGGGMTLVPLLTLIFLRKHFPAEHVVHMAVATSLTTILFTSLSSVRAHHVRGAVLWPVVWALVPGMLVGSLVRPQIVSHISSAALGTVCGAFAWFAATQMLIDRKTQPSRQLPGRVAMFGVGSGVGVLASMGGVGGAFILIPFMTWCNVRIHNAVANALWILTLHHVMNGIRMNAPPTPTMLASTPTPLPTPNIATLPGSWRDGCVLRSISICVAANHANAPQTVPSAALEMWLTICGRTSEPTSMPGTSAHTTGHSTAPRT